MKASLLLIFWVFCFQPAIPGDLVQKECALPDRMWYDGIDFHKWMNENKDGLRIWWLKAKAADWSILDCAELTDLAKTRMIQHLKEASGDDKAGNFKLLDTDEEFHKLDSRRNGILVIKLANGTLAGFRVRDTMYRRCMEFVHVEDFDESRGTVAWCSRIDLKGIRLKIEIPELLLYTNDGKLFQNYPATSNETEKIEVKNLGADASSASDNSRSAPRQQPESPPPAKPGSAPR